MINLETAKLHCKVDIDDDDALLEIYIKAALSYCEKYTGQVLYNRSETYDFDSFSNMLEIPLNPVDSVTNILYQDPEGADQTLESFRLVGNRIYPAIGEVFPSIAVPSKVMVTVTLGDMDPLEVPEEIQSAQLLLIGHWYENREAVVVGTISGQLPFAVKALLDLHRVELF